ncbi:unnamed protein product [Diamesa hyperborea]
MAKLLIILLCVQYCFGSSYYNVAECGHNVDQDCVIEAVFGNLFNNESVEVNVNCTNKLPTLTELSYSQFSKIDKIIWNGCQATRNLPYLGLKYITGKSILKFLQIENFVATTIESGTFDGFSNLETLIIKSNFIQTSGIFQGLKKIRQLDLIKNRMKNIEENAFTSLAALKTLNIKDAMTVMDEEHFGEHQVLENVSLDIDSIDRNILSNLFTHIKNLTIEIASHDDHNSSCQFLMNGTDMDWIIEQFHLFNTNFIYCGFNVESINSLKTLKISNCQMIAHGFGFELKYLPNLEIFDISENYLSYFPDMNFIGDFNKLRILNFSMNYFTKFDLEFIKHLKNLKEIHLERNSLNKIIGFELENFQFVEFFIDQNFISCDWLLTTYSAYSERFLNLIFKKNFNSINFNGLPCSYFNRQLDIISTTQDYEKENLQYNIETLKWQARELKNKNVIINPKILAIIVGASIMLGIGLTIVGLFLYNKRQLLKHQPFYHLLRDSVFQPISTVKETWKNDFKDSIKTRNLPATNYEHPISNNTTSSSENIISVISQHNSNNNNGNHNNNIYEEIPQKIY